MEIDSNYDDDQDNDLITDSDMDEVAELMADMDISDEDFLKISRKRLGKKRRKGRKGAALAKLRAEPAGDNLPLELRGERILRAFHKNSSILGDTGRGTARVYAQGATPLVYLNKFADYAAIRNVVIANTQGAAVKQFAAGLKPVGAALAVTLTQNAWGFVFKLATPFTSARFTGVTIGLTFAGTGTALSIRVDPIVNPRAWPVMMEFAVLSASANAGIGQPALATGVTATILDLDPGVVDSQTSLQIESLNLRDLGVNRPCG